MDRTFPTEGSDAGSSPAVEANYARLTQRIEPCFCAKSGDEGSIPSVGANFDELLAQYRPYLHKICRVWQLPAIEDDLMQVATLEMWRLWPLYNPERGSFLNFIAAYIPGKVRDYVRRHENVVRTPASKWFKGDYATIIHLDADEFLTRQHPATIETAADEASTADEDEALRTAVSHLKPKHRVVVEGLFFRHLTAYSLADELGITHQAVYLRLKSALAILKNSRLLKRCGFQQAAN
jgi:RNA polymerase sigma factor (sigma-70 family)